MKKMMSVLIWGILIILFAGCSSGDGNDSSNNTDTKAASFTVSKMSGSTSTVFSFDASSSTDNHDSTSLLEVRWDWENDGTFDIDWTTRKVATHQYSTTGTKTINLEVRNTEGMIHRATQTILIYNGCGTLTDWDGNTYETVKIGSQCWMAENFKGTHYHYGSPMSNVTDDHEWEYLLETRTGAYCNYDNDEKNVVIYGRLYNWYAASSPTLPPIGWHLPTEEEWQTLIDFLGGGSDANRKMRETSTVHWSYPNYSTNESGFSALPAGFRYYAGGFGQIREIADFWTATVTENDSEYSAYDLILTDTNAIHFYGNRKNIGCSIRFVKDND